MTAFPRYDSYKDSGVEWLGEIPQSWQLQNIRAVTNLKSERNRPDLPVLSVYREYGVLLKDSRDDNHNATSLDISNYKSVDVGDLVVNKMKAWQGSMGVSDYKGIVSPAYITCRINSKIIEPKFLHYLLRSKIYIGIYNALSYGVRIGQWDMHYEDFKKIPLPIPTIAEQKRIVEFLDRSTAEIDRAISQKQRLIELLKEQKAILINQAVTKGLNLNVPMRDSGLDAIGEIPKHWQVLYNRRLFREKSRKIDSPNEMPLSVSQVDGVIPSKEMREKSLRPAHYNNFKLCLPKDLIVNRFKGHLGTFFESKYRGIVTFHYGVFVPGKNINTKYFELLFHTEPYKTIYAGASNGMTVGLQNLSNQNFYDVRSIVPPVEEQDQIVLFAQKVDEEFSQGFATIKKEIDSLVDLRKILIANAVTGKIKV